jgi:hypothetical protein
LNISWHDFQYAAILGMPISTTCPGKDLSMSNIKLFQSQQIRSHWDAEQEQWLFSVIDIIQALTGNERPRKYWSDLKRKLKVEGSQLSDFIGQLKMPAADGKSYLTDVANTETLLRLIQSIPSPRAEPFKLWLAQVGYERLEENDDPELTTKRSGLTNV